MDEKEHKWKELLYTLFYEIKSEILEAKIEIDEDEYQENVRAITIPKLINYIHDSIQILILKKIEDTQTKQKEIDEKFYSWKFKEKNTQNITVSIDEKHLYENIINKLETKERILTKQLLQNFYKIEAMENKIAEYMDLENEFEEMKSKLKYEDGRFLVNDRKDNEIIIIRSENSNLKMTIKKLEEKIKRNNLIQMSKDKMINELKDEIEVLKRNYIEIKNDLNNNKTKEQLNLLNKINININSGANNKNVKNKNNKDKNYNSCMNSFKYLNDESNASSKEKLNMTDRIKAINFNIRNNGIPKNKKSKNNSKKNSLLNTTRNDSFDKTNNDFLKKYLSVKAAKRININKIYSKIIKNNKNNFINSSFQIPVYNNKRKNLKKISSMKKIYQIWNINGSKPSSITKRRQNGSNSLNYKSIS
jgi:hypothetical protein